MGPGPALPEPASAGGVTGADAEALSNAWTTRMPLPEGRSHASGAAVIGTRIYVPGGEAMSHTRTKTLFTKTLFVYNTATNTWTRKADLPIPSSRGVSAAIDGKLYVYTPRIHTTPARLYRYDPKTSSWTKRADPPRNHYDIYDPATNSWRKLKPVPTARYGAAASVLNGKLYVVGGRGLHSTYGALEVYNPATNT